MRRSIKCLRWFLLMFFFLLHGVFANKEEDADSSHVNAEEGEGGGGEEEHHEIPPAHAVLFPAFCLTIGVLVFYVLSRYLHVLPYTLVMFLIGTLMGVGEALREDADNQLHESIQLWVEIDSEVLLLVFLPGLIFKDAIGLNVHLFRVALLQCLNFAFPMVLAGTVLTALVAYYVFPFGWSFNLAMTFGAILSATDPVAVASLLEEVGAPPRLKVHISGEALLNDGAAIVFYSIFLLRYLYELDVGVGENVDAATGFAIFFRKSLGGVAVGVFFGLALLFILMRLDRRFYREENVVEVTASLAIAYIGYYVAEPVWETSGVIATLTAGLIVKFLGRAVINDAKLLDDFWTLVEHILNTVLFALGGTVWGAVIASGVKSRQGYFTGRDWGYLFALYLFLALIRAFLFVACYPFTKRVGLKTNWRETIFQIYGGLRGAVGIALAISLDNEVERATQGLDPDATSETRKLFGFVGGIAFLTLAINAPTAGPLLRKMGLADSSETRRKIVHAYEVRYRDWMIKHMVRLLAQTRFVHVNFALVRYHVPILADLTKAQLLDAVEKNKESVSTEEYRPPNLKNIIPYLKDDDDEMFSMHRVDSVEGTLEAFEKDQEAHARKLKRELRTKRRKNRRSKSTMRFMVEEQEPLSMQELRTLFISILRSAYEIQIRDGELEDRQFLSVTLEQSLEFAADAVANGEPLKDWEFVHIIDGPLIGLAKRSKNQAAAAHCCAPICKCTKQMRDNFKNDLRRLKIERCLSFMAAHRWAQKFFRREFENADSELSESGKRVINESQAQYDLCETELKSSDPRDVEIVSSHKFCSILLNSGVYYVSKLVRAGLLKDDEAEKIVEELEHNLDKVRSCDDESHPGELQISQDEESGGVRSSVIAEMKTSYVNPTSTPFAY